MELEEMYDVRDSVKSRMAEMLLEDEVDIDELKDLVVDLEYTQTKIFWKDC